MNIWFSRAATWIPKYKLVKLILIKIKLIVQRALRRETQRLYVVLPISKGGWHRELRHFSFKDDVNVILLLGVSIMCICLWILLFANVDTNNVQLLVHPLFAFSTAHIWLFLERKHDITGLFFICCCISYVDISRTKDIIYIWKE
jgi:hypothetical protein